MSSGGSQVLAGKYRLISPLGRGGMGQVFRAEHLTLHSPIAIKLMGAELMQSADGVARFMREAHAAATIRSPHVVQILDFGVDAGVPYIAMELLEGESLAARLQRVGRLSPAETSRVLTQVGRAITRAHEAGVIHRDLKPDNVFLVQNEEEELTKVLDFGIAKSTAPGPSGSQGTCTGAVLGTPDYMSPEQAEGARTLDHRSDIWSMGVIAFECILGRRPFLGESFGTLLLAICARPLPVPSTVGQVPVGFDEWFGKACARAPEGRFNSAREAAAELRRICDVNAPTTGSQAAKLGLEKTVPIATPFDLPLSGLTAPGALTAAVPSVTTMDQRLQSFPDTAVPLSVTENTLTRSASSGVGLKLAASFAAALGLLGGGVWFAFLRTTPSADATSVVATSEPTAASALTTVATAISALPAASSSAASVTSAATKTAVVPIVPVVPAAQPARPVATPAVRAVPQAPAVRPSPAPAPPPPPPAAPPARPAPTGVNLGI